MIVTFFKSIVDNIKNRVKNPFSERNTTPFGGAYIIALVIYNWELLFSLITFDSGENRLSKIQIISDFLTKEEWYCRIGIPVLIAFGTILFYYIFNNISLGVTTFFNRWVKSFIYFLTDRSKNITREEYEKSINDTNLVIAQHEELKKRNAESATLIENMNNEIKNIKAENIKNNRTIKEF